MTITTITAPVTAPPRTRAHAVQVLPPGAPRHTWLREREKSIGGGEAAAVAGLSKYCSPYELWLIKTGRYVVPETPKMRAGTLLEPMTVALFEAETGLECTEAGMWRTTSMPWQHANPDRFTSDGHGLECKATFDWGARDYADGPTPHAIVQSQWYMHITGRRRWYIAVLTDGWDLRWWWMDRDDHMIAMLIDDVAYFWHEHVVTDIPPPVDGTEYTRDAIRRAYGYEYEAGTGVEVPGLSEWVDERRALKESIKHLAADLTLVENKIKAALGDHEYGTEHGVPRIEWKARGETSYPRYLKEL